MPGRGSGTLSPGWSPSADRARKVAQVSGHMRLCVLHTSQDRFISRLHEEGQTKDIFCDVFGGLVGVVSYDESP